MKKVFMICALLFANASHAGLLIEPYLGYSLSKGEDELNPVTEWDQKTPFWGARLGYQTFGLMAGLDFTHHMEGDFEMKSGSGTQKFDADQKSYGVFVGYNLPVLLRFWAAYYFKSEISFNSGATSGLESSGQGFALGAGYTGLPWLSLNLEYRMLEFDESEFRGVKTTYSGADVTDFNQLMFSVSLPLDF